MQHSSKFTKTFSPAPFQPPPRHHRCLRRCWSLRRCRLLLGLDSCEGVFLRPGTDNQSISILASTTLEQKAIDVFIFVDFTLLFNDALINKAPLTWLDGSLEVFSDLLRHWGLHGLKDSKNKEISLVFLSSKQCVFGFQKYKLERAKLTLCRTLLSSFRNHGLHNSDCWLELPPLETDDSPLLLAQVSMAPCGGQLFIKCCEDVGKLTGTVFLSGPGNPCQIAFWRVPKCFHAPRW